MDSSKTNYGNIKAYMDYLKTFKLTQSIFPGRFYTYNYKFRKDYDWDDLKFYDFMPLAFIFEIDPQTNSAIGMNFHHMPVKARILWLNRLKKLAGQWEKLQVTDKEAFGFKTQSNRPVYKITGLNYPRVYKILMKSKIAIRRYKLDKMFYLRNIDIGSLDEAMNYFAKTYVAVDINAIKSRYANYNP